MLPEIVEEVEETTEERMDGGWTACAVNSAAFMPGA